MTFASTLDPSRPLTRRVFASALAGSLFAVFHPVAEAHPRCEEDVTPKNLHPDVRWVLEYYAAVLRRSGDLDTCAERFLAVAGGGLVDEDGRSLRSTVKPYSLKNDFERIDRYADPTIVKRVVKLRPTTSGFGASAIHGDPFKIWIEKAEGEPGLPAVVTILVPHGHPTIRSPKVVRMGSL